MKTNKHRYFKSSKHIPIHLNRSNREREREGEGEREREMIGFVLSKIEIIIIVNKKKEEPVQLYSTYYEKLMRGRFFLMHNYKKINSKKY